MKLRGHDGAVLLIAFWDQAAVAHARAGKLRHGFFDGRKVICWEPPPPPPPTRPSLFRRLAMLCGLTRAGS